MKPMLAVDADPEKIQYPCIVMPKWDGVRGINLNGRFTGRSLEPHGNRWLQQLFSYDAFQGLDGELVLNGADPASLCRLTTSAVNTQEGEPDILWYLFDYIHPHVEGTSYMYRLVELEKHVKQLSNNMDRRVREAATRLRLVPWANCQNSDQLEQYETQALQEGYEGIVIRDPFARHKNGRSTVNQGGFLRIKRFSDGDAVVIGITEGRKNNNEATINALGRTERSSHKANMVPNGMVGNMLCKDAEGKEFIVAPGCMTHMQRKHFFKHPEDLLGYTIRYKKFLHGQKDAPRFPTFQGFRIDADKV